ncbi:MAG: iron-containing alcohol dehydrogenase, partial [Bacteroidia bacterium]
MIHKNFKSIEKTVFGRGSFNQLADIISPKRGLNQKYFVYIIDQYFKGKDLENSLQELPEDLIYFIDVDPHEPTTEQIDTLRDEILATKGLPSGVIGIGGGSIMDIAKALSLMLCNEGKSELYQGLN